MIGHVSEFNPAKEEFNSYVERLDQFFIVNDVEETKKVPLFITLIGPETYSVLKHLLDPVTPVSKSFTELVGVLSHHFQPKRLIIAERVRFYKRSQLPGETLSTYIVELRKMASTCNFKGFLDEALRDRLICGLSSEVVQRRLVMEPELTFEKACILAQELGQAESQSQLLRAAVPAVTAPSEGVLKVEQGPRPARSRGQRGGAPQGRGGQQNQPRCWRCGRGHSPDSCVVRTWECRRCGRKGHIAKVCRMDSARIHGVDGSHDGVAAEGVSLEDEGGINGIHSTGFQGYFADL